jgi:4-carboxymuconolactone decarboxylase
MDMSDDSDLIEKGRRVRESVLGPAHSGRTARNRNKFNADFQDFLFKYSWAEIWARPGLDKKQRAMITIAMLCAMGRAEELRLHIRATQYTGLSEEEVSEILMHATIYAGVPAAFGAFQVAQQVYAEMETEKEQGKTS